MERHLIPPRIKYERDEKEVIPPRGPAGSFSAPSRKLMRAIPSHPLPKGWYEATAENGSSYYYDDSGNRQWQRPGKPVDPTSRMEEMEPARSPHWDRRKRRRSEFDERTSSVQSAQHSTNQSFHADLPPLLPTSPRPDNIGSDDLRDQYMLTAPLSEYNNNNQTPSFKTAKASWYDLAEGGGRRELKGTNRKDRSPIATTPMKGTRKSSTPELVANDLLPLPMHRFPSPLISTAPSPYKPSNSGEDGESSSGQQSRPMRQYKSYHAPGTQFRTYQGLGGQRRRDQSSTAMSEMHSRPTMLAYSERYGVYGSQPIPPVMAEDGERVTYLEEAPYDPPTPDDISYEHDEEKDELWNSDIAPERILERERLYNQEIERRPREVNSKPMKRSYLGTSQQHFTRDRKGAAAGSSEDYATRGARYLEQRALEFGRQEGEKTTRNDKDNPGRFHRKKMKYTISEDLTEGRSRRLKERYLALECSQSPSLYALRK